MSNPKEAVEDAHVQHNDAHVQHKEAGERGAGGV